MKRQLPIWCRKGDDVFARLIAAILEPAPFGDGWFPFGFSKTLMNTQWSRHFFRLRAARALGALAGQLLCVGTLLAQAVSVSVPATAAIWLAGQSPGTERFGDVDPTNAPVAVELSAFAPALPLVFQVGGRTSRCTDGDPLVDADGETEGGVMPQSWRDVPPALSLSGLVCSFSALVGVFLDSHAVAPVPPSLRFVDDGEKAFADLSPALQQVFFIGDGRTGRGTGLEQRFTIPAAADVLCLELFDAENKNNVGQLAVTIGTAQPMSLRAAPGTAGSVLLTWSGRPGLTLQKTVSLTNPNWQDVAGSAGASEIEQPCDAAAAFFRLVKP